MMMIKMPQATMLPYICETKGIQGDSDLAEDIIDALYELDERESKGET